MTGDNGQPRPPEIPQNWDVLDGSAEDDHPLEAEAAVVDSDDSPPTINLVASSWADAVVALAVCIAGLIGANTAGQQGAFTSLPWAAALGVAWWLAAATALVIIRQGTPGMLLAGVVFGHRVTPRRLAVVITAAAGSAALLGLPNLLGTRHSPLALAAGSELESASAD